MMIYSDTYGVDEGVELDPKMLGELALELCCEIEVSIDSTLPDDIWDAQTGEKRRLLRLMPRTGREAAFPLRRDPEDTMSLQDDYEEWAGFTKPRHVPGPVIPWDEALVMQAECVAERAKWPVCPVCVERVSPFDEFMEVNGNPTHFACIEKEGEL